MGIRFLPGPEVEFRVYWKTEAVKKKQNKPKNLGVVAHTSDPRIGRVGAGGMEVQSQLHSEFKGTLTLMGLSQRKKRGEDKRRN